MFTKIIIKVSIAIPILALVYVLWGTMREHGNITIGLWYLFWTIPAVVISIFSYWMYYVTERHASPRYSALKAYVHLIPGFAATLLDPVNAAMIWIALLTLAVLNTGYLLRERFKTPL